MGDSTVPKTRQKRSNRNAEAQYCALTINVHIIVPRGYERLSVNEALGWFAVGNPTAPQFPEFKLFCMALPNPLCCIANIISLLE